MILRKNQKTWRHGDRRSDSAQRLFSVIVATLVTMRRITVMMKTHIYVCRRFISVLSSPLRQQQLLFWFPNVSREQGKVRSPSVWWSGEPMAAVISKMRKPLSGSHSVKLV